MLNIQQRADKFVSEIEDLAQRKIAENEKKEIIKNYRGDDESVTFESIFNEVKDSPRREFISTGYPLLDKYLGGGFKAGELVLLTGSTNNGKTSFAFDMTRNMKSQNCFWLPFEESAEELAEKVLAYKQEPIHFFTPKKIVKEDMDWIEERLLETKLKNNTKVVFIDNMHYVTMTDSDAFVKTGLFCKRLRELAQKLEIVIILIAHLRKCPQEKMPSYEDISGDSDASKIANKIISVWRECKRDIVTGRIDYTPRTIIITQKIRGAYGTKGNIPCNWHNGVYTEDDLTSDIIKFNQKESERIDRDF